MKKHYETHVEDTDKLISVAGPVLDYKSWYEQYRKLMEEQAQRKYGLYTPTSGGDDDDFPSIPGITARYSALGLTNEQMAENPVWKDLTGNGHDLQMKNFAWKGMSGVGGYGDENYQTFFYNGYGATRGEFTIEILPLYPGALVFDGVDDYGVCENFPILTKEKGYTVVALRQWIEEKNSVTALASNSKNWNQDGAFVFEYNNLENNYPNIEISFGSNNMFDRGLSPYSYQTSKSYNGNLIESGSFLGSDKLVVAKANENLSSNSNIAIWELVFLDHDATEEELTKIKDYFVKTYPWLFPDQAWTVTGKTNEDEDRATIANITGNGNDLVLSNFGFAEGSGYGLYAYNFNSFNLKDNVVKPTDVKKDSFRIIGTGNSGNVLVLSNTSNSAAWKIRITGMKEGDSCIVGNANKSGDYIKIIKDGIYTFQKQYAATSINGIWYNSSQEVDVLVEQIPEYEGYLVTDGVDDKIQSSSFTMNEDWTIVGDWELLSNVQINCGIVKAQNVYLYNTANGLLISINNPRSLQRFGTKSLHAICSDGRLYDRNWVEYEYTADQNFEIVKSSLNIGFNLNNYARIAFKNLGIYNNQILSKDDCIKAYNYLQTLKSK